jgi:DNA helicase-2/ATP-dependent DNA helicase PcrA
MFEGKKIMEAADWIGVRMSGRGVSADEGGMTKGFDAGDRILFMTNLARVRGVPLSEQYAIDHDNLSWSLVDRVARGLEEFKTKRGLRDFTDLLQEFVDTGFQVPLEVLIVDEAQDLSRLQWAVVERLASVTRRVVIGGDDDQAIFQWAGADVQTFIDMPGRVLTLDQSWRVPRSVAEVASEVLSRVKNRRPKTWKPRLDENGNAVEGEVKRVVSLDEVDFQSGEDTLVLSRNLAPLRDDAEPLLRGDGIMYENQYGYSSVKRSVVDAILTWERLRRGEHVPVSEVEKVYEQMSVGRGFLRGHKKLPGFPDRDAMVDMEALVMHGGLTTDLIWHEALEKMAREDRVYMTKALRTGQKLTEKPTVRLSTIHGSKGGEAQHVVLLRDVAYRTAREAQDQWEQEARVFYVGVTRAKRKLTIVAPQTRHSYDV